MSSGPLSPPADLDGTLIDVVSDVALDGTEGQTVILEWATTAGDSGGYTATVSSDDAADSVSVTVTEP